MGTDTDRNVCGCPVIVDDYDYVNGVSFSEKYEKMGTTPRELKCRQDGICYLKVIYDQIEDTYEFGELFCTDGTEYSPTRSLLNPSFECVKCMTNFILNEIKNNMEVELKLNKVLVKLLSIFSAASDIKNKEEQKYIVASKETIDWLETYFSKGTLSSDISNPIKLDKSSTLSLMNVPLLADSAIEYGKLVLMPEIVVVDLELSNG